MFGFLNINKPKGMTSHDVISNLRKVLKIKQIGHSGTLDPLATGVLPVGIGKATRLLEYLSDEKAYIATIEFGKISDTYDIEGIIKDYSDKNITIEELTAVAVKFTGLITQIPPVHSAVHYKGKRLYELARDGVIPDDIPTRQVQVDSIKILKFDEISRKADMEIICSKGTYIRSIAHDIGQMLEVGAIMTELKRTQSSNFLISDSVNLSDIKSGDDIKNRLINPLDVLLYNQKLLSLEELVKVKNGNSIENIEFKEGEKLLLKHDNNLIAVADVVQNLIKVNKVLI